MSDFGVKVSKTGENVLVVDDKDLAVSGQFTTAKVAKTGTLTLSLPGEWIDFGDYVTRTAAYNHGLGYVPLYLPSVACVSNINFATADDFICNDHCYFIPLLFGYGPATHGEWAWVKITSTQLILTATRANSAGLDEPRYFGDHDVILYYTIFYNRVDTEFNLL